MPFRWMVVHFIVLQHAAAETKRVQLVVMKLIRVNLLKSEEHWARIGSLKNTKEVCTAK